MNTVFENVIQMSFNSGFIILALCFLRLVLRGTPRWLVCGLWFLAAIRLIVPFTIESEHGLLPSADHITQMVAVDKEVEYNYSSDFLLWQGSGTLEPGKTHTEDAIGTAENEESDAVDQYGDVKATQQAKTSTINNLRVLFPYIWLIGVAAVFAYGMVGYIVLYRRSAPFIPAEGRIRESEFIFSPFILGFLRPKIYLPKGLHEPIRSHVLAHEKAHLQRCDHLIKPIGFIILAIHWFNPLVWLAYILLSRDIEMACDERVISRMTKDQRSSYAESLLNYSTGNARVTRRLLNACPLAFGEVSMKKRIKAVVDFKRPATWAIALSLISAVLIGALFFTNDIAVSNADEEPASLENVKEWNPELSTDDFTDENGVVRWPAELLPAGVPDPTHMIEEINLVEKMGDEVHIIFTSKTIVENMANDRNFEPAHCLFSIELATSEEFVALSKMYDYYGYVNKDGYLIELHNFSNSVLSAEDDSYEYYESLDEGYKHPYLYLKQYADKYVTRGEQRYYNGFEVGDAITIGSTTELILTKRDDIPDSVFYEYPEEDTSLGLETIEFTEWPTELLPAGFPNPSNYDGIELISIRQDDTGIILQIGGGYHDTLDYGREVKKSGMMQIEGRLGNGSKYFMANENGDYVYVTEGWLDDYYSGRVDRILFNAYTVDTFKICPFNDKVIID